VAPKGFVVAVVVSVRAKVSLARQEKLLRNTKTQVGDNKAKKLNKICAI
jgi:hypothetical protein